MTPTTEFKTASALKAYEAPRLVSLDHRNTEVGAPGLLSDANETVVNTGVTSSDAPS